MWVVVVLCLCACAHGEVSLRGSAEAMAAVHAGGLSTTFPSTAFSLWMGSQPADLNISLPLAQASSPDGCRPQRGRLDGSVVLLQFGACLWWDAAKRMQDAGALAVLHLLPKEGVGVTANFKADSVSDPHVSIPWLTVADAIYPVYGLALNQSELTLQITMDDNPFLSWWSSGGFITVQVIFILWGIANTAVAMYKGVAFVRVTGRFAFDSLAQWICVIEFLASLERTIYFGDPVWSAGVWDWTTSSFLCTISISFSLATGVMSLFVWLGAASVGETPLLRFKWPIIFSIVFVFVIDLTGCVVRSKFGFAAEYGMLEAVIYAISFTVCFGGSSVAACYRLRQLQFVMTPTRAAAVRRMIRLYLFNSVLHFTFLFGMGLSATRFYRSVGGSVRVCQY